MKFNQIIYYSEYWIVLIAILLASSFFNIPIDTLWLILFLLLPSMYLNRLSPYMLGLNQSRQTFLKLVIFESVLMAFISMIIVSIINCYKPNRISLFSLKISNQLPLLIFLGLIVSMMVIIGFGFALERYDERIMWRMYGPILAVLLPLIFNNSTTFYGDFTKQVLNDLVLIVLYLVEIRIFNYYLKLANLYKDPASRWQKYQ